MIPALLIIWALSVAFLPLGQAAHLITFASGAALLCLPLIPRGLRLPARAAPETEPAPDDEEEDE